MVFPHHQTILIMKGTVAGYLTNMARPEENVESVAIHGLKIPGIMRLREVDTQRVQSHNGTNLVFLYVGV